MRRLLVAMMAAIIILFASVPQGNADAGIDGATNATRAAYGKPAIAVSSTLTALAGQRIQEVVSDVATIGWNTGLHKYWWWGPSGCSGIGENIAANQSDAARAVEQWLNSTTGHRENLLGDWDVMGSAQMTSGGVTYYIQLFGRGCGGGSSAPAPAPAPAAPQPVSKAPQVQAATPQPQPVMMPDTSMRP